MSRHSISSVRARSPQSRAGDLSPASGETIRFAVRRGSLGFTLVAESARGVCAILLGDDEGGLAESLRARFPAATFSRDDADAGADLARAFALIESAGVRETPKLDLRGTAFRRRVWAALARIPAGETRTYAAVARMIGEPRATRAVAGACAANPVAVAIPCHRVVRTDGEPGGYRWGVWRKLRLLERERAERA